MVPLGIAALLVAALVLRAHPASRAGAKQQGRVVGRISDAERAATFTFPPGIAEPDRQAILRAVADARPEAQRLIAAVDGLVDLRVAGTQAGVVGVTQPAGSRFVVTLNLGLAMRIHGQRGIDRLVLHELGHVVDFALVPPAMDARLDAEIPRGYGCEEGQTGACANPLERFAETFAKWATRDIGFGVDLGYKVPPPDDLESWGAPLDSLLKT
ncbi:MAG TPA: hypothetical protein VFG42_06450 [Baekduia sp.]|uniref:hypothetical protein n=1 Tax=Baekduia sp. TaxID=2600305 RepID=UPI002D7680CA|nr:hypothetical protein [Baekduia sp.]HET6506410.1 hypothetical protein [Baekduia sp.]